MTRAWGHLQGSCDVGKVFMLIVDQKDHACSCIETVSLTSMHSCWQFGTEAEPHVVLNDRKAFTGN